MHAAQVSTDGWLDKQNVVYTTVGPYGRFFKLKLEKDCYFLVVGPVEPATMLPV